MRVNLTCDIYLIVNLITNKIYIGSASNIENRWAVHKYDLRNNQHGSIYLQHSWNKHSEANFGFSILEECSEADRVNHEQFWLDYTQCYNKEKGYNICKIAGATIGYRHSEEIKKKIGEASKGNSNVRNKIKWPCEAGNKCRCIDCRQKMRNYWNMRDKKRGKRNVVK